MAVGLPETYSPTPHVDVHVTTHLGTLLKTKTLLGM